MTVASYIMVCPRQVWANTKNILLTMLQLLVIYKMISRGRTKSPKPIPLCPLMLQPVLQCRKEEPHLKERRRLDYEFV